MKRMALLPLMATAMLACTTSQGGDDSTSAEELAQCPPGQTVLYSKVTPPSAGVDGASGVGAAPAVLGGSDDAGSSGAGGPVGASDAGPSASPSPSPTPGAPFASTTTSCVPSVCPAGQVAVPTLVPESTSSGGTGVASPPIDVVDAGGTTPTPPPPASPPPATPTPGAVVCTAPPPPCATGEAPSYAPAGFWHCMPLCDPKNADLVVISYGGIYGNGGVCASPPPATACPVAGQVWTWNFMVEAWSCEAECDNGQYDQHTFAGQVVCVPC